MPRNPNRPALPRKINRPASIAQAAEYADVSERTVHRWIAGGHLTAYRVGLKLVRVDLDDVDRLIQPIPAPEPAPRRYAS